jgi:hypothetical protein
MRANIKITVFWDVAPASIFKLEGGTDISPLIGGF